MLHIWMIVVFVIVLSYDSVAELAASHGRTMPQPLSGWLGLGVAIAPAVGLALGTHIVLVMCRRRAERGSHRAVLLADRTLAFSRWSAVLLHGAAVFGLGLLSQIRALVGNIVLLDELLAVMPPLLVVVAGWWSSYPLEALTRGAVALRRLDEGIPLTLWPTRVQSLRMNIRHQLLLSLAPIAILSAWAEGTERLLHWMGTSRWFAERSPRGAAWLAQKDVAASIHTVLQLAGVAAVLTVSPLILSMVWDTVRLGPGAMRDRLMAMCAHSGVRIRELLVWRTHGTMINGAVIGVLGRLRYILLTDALLQALPRRQVEAVMAHEVAHAKHAHVPWLIASLAVGVVGGGLALSMLMVGVLLVVHMLGWAELAVTIQDSMGVQGLLMIGSLVLGFLGFGFVSRRFEWQADAFAVKQLTMLKPDADGTQPAEDHMTGSLFEQQMGVEAAGQPLVTREAVAAMTEALDAVAVLNHLPREQMSFRHGSIAHRQRRLQKLVGVPLDSLKIDRSVRRLKWVLGMGGAGVIGLMVVGQLMARWLGEGS